MDNVGERLKKIRKEHNYTQDMLAEKLGLEPAAISKYETNRVPIPQEHIIKICNLFEISADYLLGINNNELSMAASSDIDLAKLAKIDKSKKDAITDNINNMINMFYDEFGRKE